MGLGNRVYGAAGIALGVIGLIWGDFAAPWHAVPAELLAPASGAYAPLAYAAAALFLIGGLAMQRRRTAAGGALVLAALFAVFVLLRVWEAIHEPKVFVHWLGVAEQSGLVIGGAVAAVNVLHDIDHPRRARIGQIAFGLCLFVFGAAHFVYAKETATLVPAWLPSQPVNWVYATGAAHILAGIAMLSGVASVIASRLLVLMFVGFGALVWAPMLKADLHSHFAWGGNAINLALIAAAWVLAESISRSKTEW
jgi:uncharacterized membrane protein